MWRGLDDFRRCIVSVVNATNRLQAPRNVWKFCKESQGELRVSDSNVFTSISGGFHDWLSPAHLHVVFSSVTGRGRLLIKRISLMAPYYYLSMILKHQTETVYELFQSKDVNAEKSTRSPNPLQEKRVNYWGGLWIHISGILKCSFILLLQINSQTPFLNYHLFLYFWYSRLFGGRSFLHFNINEWKREIYI